MYPLFNRNRSQNGNEGERSTHRYSNNNVNDNFEDENSELENRVIRGYYKKIYQFSIENEVMYRDINEISCFARDSEENINTLPLFNNCEFLNTLEIFGIPLSLIQKVMETRTFEDIKSSYYNFSTELLDYFIAILKTEEGYAFKKVEKGLMLALKNFLVCYDDSSYEIKLSYSSERLFRDVFDLPLSFEIRRLLIVLLILFATHPSREGNYEVKCIVLKRALVYNVIMPEFINILNYQPTQGISKEEEYEYRVMVKLFLQIFCDTVSFEGIFFDTQRMRIFLLLFKDVSTAFFEEVNNYICLFSTNNNMECKKKIEDIVHVMEYCFLPLDYLCTLTGEEKRNFFNNTDIVEIFVKLTRAWELFWNCEYSRYFFLKSNFDIALKRIFTSLVSVILRLCRVEPAFEPLVVLYDITYKWCGIIDNIIKMEDLEDSEELENFEGSEDLTQQQSVYIQYYASLCYFKYRLENLCLNYRVFSNVSVFFSQQH